MNRVSASSRDALPCGAGRGPVCDACVEAANGFLLVGRVPNADSKKRTRLDRDARRERLLEVGIELFKARPYDAISIDEIAEAAGIAKGLLYHYFPTKRRFYVETVRAAAEHFGALISEASPRTRAKEERVRGSLDAYLDYVQNHSVGYEHLMKSGVGLDPEIQAIIEGQRTALAQRILSDLGVDPIPPALPLAIRAWLGFVEAGSLEWLRSPAISRTALRSIFEATLPVTIAAALDPAFANDADD